MNKTEAKQAMSEYLSAGIAILTATHVIDDVPVIHDMPNPVHLGFGAFKFEIEEDWGIARFSGGGAMKRVLDDEGAHMISWTPLVAAPSIYYFLGIDLEKQKAGVKAW
ncbi:MAG: hypothetical protein KAJ73_02280 [Zetaproteobacteria bacterium]|nr:hypothetical protein [Zetaproteobacteria bacterium]